MIILFSSKRKTFIGFVFRVMYPVPGHEIITNIPPIKEAVRPLSFRQIVYIFFNIEVRREI